MKLRVRRDHQQPSTPDSDKSTSPDQVCPSCGHALHTYNAASLHLDTFPPLPVYTDPSSAPSHTALLSHFLRSQFVLPYTAATIVLGWTPLWTFLEDLRTLLASMEYWVLRKGARVLEVIRDEHREPNASVSSWFLPPARFPGLWSSPPEKRRS